MTSEYFDATLQANVDGIKKIVRTDQDFLLVVCGYEGSGKSTVADEIALEIDPGFSAKNINFTTDEFNMNLESYKKYSAVVLDEGAVALFSRNAMSRESREMVRTMTTIRSNNLIIIICIPTIMVLDSYIKAHRIRAMVRVVGRGRYAFYSRKKCQQIHQDPTSKQIVYPEPNFYGWFKKLSGPMWDEYLRKKEAFKKSSRSRKVWKEKLRLEKKMEKSYTLAQIGTIVGVSKKGIANWVYKEKLAPKREQFIDIHGERRLTEKGFKALLKNKERKQNFSLRVRRRSWAKP